MGIHGTIRRLRYIGISAGFMLLPVGCKPPAVVEDIRTPPAADSSSVPIQLSVATWSGGTSLQLQQSVIEQYMAEHPNVHVTLHTIPYAEYRSTLLAQPGGDGAVDDLMLLDNWLLAPLAKAGAVIDLTPYIQGAGGIQTADYYEHIWQFGRFDDKPYAMPKDWSNMAVLYNKAIFDAASMPYPTTGWTWEELFRTAEALTVRRNGETASWGVDMYMSTQEYFQPILLAYSDGIIKPDGSRYGGYMNSDGVVRALQLLLDARRNGVINIHSDRVAGQKDLFERGELAMTITGRWNVWQYKKNEALSFAAVPLPVGPKGGGNMIFYGGWGISGYSPRKEAAWELLKYMSGPKGARVFGDYGFSAHKLVAEEKGQTVDPDFRAFMDDMLNIKMTPEYYDPFFSEAGAPAIQRVLDRIVYDPAPFDLREQLDEAAAEADDQLARRKMTR